MLTLQIHCLAVNLQLHHTNIAVFYNQFILGLKGLLILGAHHASKDFLAIGLYLQPTIAGSLHSHLYLVQSYSRLSLLNVLLRFLGYGLGHIFKVVHGLGNGKIATQQD